jgi:hypothetical protein
VQPYNRDPDYVAPTESRSKSEPSRADQDPLTHSNRKARARLQELRMKTF